MKELLPSSTSNGEFKTAFKRQCYRCEAVRRVVDEREVVSVGISKLSGVVGDYDGSRAQRRCDEFQRRTCHRRPDVDQHEINWRTNISKCLAQVAFTEVDQIGTSSLSKAGACGFNLFRFELRADHDSFSAVGEQVVSHSSGKEEGRNAKRRSCFNYSLCA